MKRTSNFDRKQEYKTNSIAKQIKWETNNWKDGRFNRDKTTINL